MCCHIKLEQTRGFKNIKFKHSTFRRPCFQKTLKEENYNLKLKKIGIRTVFNYKNYPMIIF
jgi:hypothetical protein